MMFTLKQAADQLGKSTRQVRYLIKSGQIPATKVGHQWRIDSEQLPRTPGQEAARERKQANLQEAVTDALSLPATRRKRYSVKDLRAFRIAAPLYQQAVTHLGADHAVCRLLEQTLEELARVPNMLAEPYEMKMMQHAGLTGSGICRSSTHGPPVLVGIRRTSGRATFSMFPYL